MIYEFLAAQKVQVSGNNMDRGKYDLPFFQLFKISI